MKTPQEEAERLIHETVQPVMFFTETQQRLERHLAETIPLTELIAVARAADTVLVDYMAYFVDWELMDNYKTYKPEYPVNVLRAQAALQALRATGKVEL